MISRSTLRVLRTGHPPLISRTVTAARFYSEQKGDPLHQSFASGKTARSNPEQTGPLDAANPHKNMQADREGLSGNKEGVGFAEQVGSRSASASSSVEGFTGKENITPPSFMDAVKNKLGFKTTAGEDKQNRGGGKGVTGTGRPAFDSGKRTIHLSAVARMPAGQTKGQAPEASRQPKDKTNADQSAHLKHKSSSSKPDSGKGNAAENPVLPSQHVDNSWKSRPTGQQQQKRKFSVSARALSQDHTAESYFKDVDSTKPTNTKVHQVDGSMTGAPVECASDEPDTGEFSRSGPQSKEYETVSKHDQPYDTPPSSGPEKDEKLRYGGKPDLRDSVSKPDEGPEGANKGGRKPEGSS